MTGRVPFPELVCLPKLLALLCLLSLPALADEPPERARVVHVRTSSYVLQHRTDPKSPPHEQRRALRLESTYVRARGPQGYRVTFERWQRREGKRLDTSLAGREVRFAPGKSPEVVEAPDADPLSKAARRYLERLKRELGAPSAALFLPPPPSPAKKRPETWSPDLSRVTERLVPDAKLDSARSTLVAKSGAEGVEVSGTLQLRTFPGSTARVTQGGAWKLTLTCGPLDAPARLVSRKHSASFRAQAEDLRPDGTPMQLRVRASEEESLVVEALTD